MTCGVWRPLLLLLLLLLARAAPVAAGPYDPALAFRTTRTPHFSIHYHQGEEAIARRLGTIAEATHVRLSMAWSLPLDRLTHVVVADQVDVSNGTATVVPWNAIVIYPVPPSGSQTIGNTDDWLEYVFTHEYAHILHLDRSRGWARAARAIFGRSPIAFPNLTLPLWHIEGLATLAESEGGHGRLHAGDFREIVDVAARSAGLEPLDRVNGGLVAWPAGQGWYAYGARFHQYLAKAYGAERMRQLSDRTAGRLPFLTSGAFRAVYGKSLGTLWREFQDAVRGDAAADTAPAARTVERLTEIGYVVDGPREGPDGSVYFTSADAHRFPGIYRLPRGSGTPERVTSRYGGTYLSVGPRDVLFDQLEFVRGTALLSDLYLFDLGSRRTRRLTRAARLIEADRPPDGRRIAALQVVPGGRDLVVLDAERLLGSGRPLAGDALPVLARVGEMHGVGVVYATPRWSPDGRYIAAERRRIDGPSTIVVLDGRSLREVVEVIAARGERVVQPAWSPDGATLLFAATEGGRTFQIRAIDLGPGGRATVRRPVLDVPGGAQAPLLTRDGRLVYVGYTPAGHDLFEARPDLTQPASTEEVFGAPPLFDATPPAAAAGAPYRPWGTVAPRAWAPVVEQRDGRWRVGPAAVGVDVLQRHVIAASATWAVTGARALAPRARPDWDAVYTYQRWQPALYVAARDRTALFDVVTGAGAFVPVAQREQTMEVGLWRPFRRVRRVQSILAAYHVERFTTDTASARDVRTRAGLRASWTLSTARRYGYSISQEDGVTLALTGEALRPALGADGVSDAVTADARGYLPMGIPHGVFAVRGAVAASRGDAGVQRLFRLGGSDGDPSAGVFGSDAIGLLRGFQDRIFAGDRVALVNLEARVPLWSVERGRGTWPLFLRTVHATAFTDVGHAWSGRGDWRDRKVGYGLEVSADVVAGFGLPLTWTAGMAWGTDGARRVTDAREVYVRIGRSF